MKSLERALLNIKEVDRPGNHEDWGIVDKVKSSHPIARQLEVNDVLVIDQEFQPNDASERRQAPDSCLPTRYSVLFTVDFQVMRAHIDLRW